MLRAAPAAAAAGGWGEARHSAPSLWALRDVAGGRAGECPRFVRGQCRLGKKGEASGTGAGCRRGRGGGLRAPSLCRPGSPRIPRYSPPPSACAPSVSMATGHTCLQRAPRLRNLHELLGVARPVTGGRGSRKNPGEPESDAHTNNPRQHLSSSLSPFPFTKFA